MTDNLPPFPKNVMNVLRRIRACESEAPAQLVLEHALHDYARVAIESALRAAVPEVPEGWKLVPDWKGYALLGTGHYVINHTADFDEKLGAELLITMATEEDKSGNRQIGESRDVTDPKLIESDQMVIRIGFLNERGLFALEDQLRHIRQIHFTSPQAPQAEPPVCQRCKGSGEREYMTNHLGPDDYEVTGLCDECGGSGEQAPQADHSEDALGMVQQAAQPVQPSDTQWQKRHPLRTEGKWENTNEPDAKWWRGHSQGWEIRVLYAAPVAQAKPEQAAQPECTCLNGQLGPHYCERHSP